MKLSFHAHGVSGFFKMKNFKLFFDILDPFISMENTRISKKLLTFPRNQLKFNEFRYDCIYFARIFKKLFTFSTPKKRMPYALNEANFKKLFTFFVVLKSWKTQITNAVQSKNFYFLLASIQIRRASLLLQLSESTPEFRGRYVEVASC